MLMAKTDEFFITEYLSKVRRYVETSINQQQQIFERARATLMLF
jgi:hypothetical protein